jgi:hypothetical protein
MSRDEDGFLARWSRTKRGADAREPEAARDRPEADPALPQEERVPAEPETRDDAEILEALGLKDPDLMESGDDFAAFMREAVPQHLRQRALRRLWRSNPVLANLDGLNDYDTDFTGGSVAPGMLRTSYQVGLGIVRAAAETDLPAPPEAGPDAEPSTAEADIRRGHDPAGEAAEDDALSHPATESGKESQILQNYDRSPARKRMRFQFEG